MSEKMTAKQMIEKWDANEPVPSIVMGGLGPAYEQAIQIAAIEMLRAALTEEFPTEEGKFDKDRWFKLCDDVLNKDDLNDELGGITGAMYGAASWLALQWLRGDGPDELRGRVEKEDSSTRLILINKLVPTAP